MRLRLALGLLLMGAVGGCTRLEAGRAFNDVRRSAGERANVRLEWRGVTAEDQAVDDAIDQMLQNELSVDQAVQIALLNNRSLQATYEQLGIAQAQLVQAGLLHNPIFDLEVRWPDESPRGANVEMSLVQNFLDILLLPARKRIAAAEFDDTSLRVSNEVMELAAKVRAEFYSLQSKHERVALHEKQVTTADAGAEMARRLRAAGNITELELAEHEAHAAETNLELLAARADLQSQHEGLARTLGVSSSRVRVNARLPDPPRETFQLEALEQQVLSHRFDVQAARRKAKARAQSARLSNATRYLSELELGASAERETDGEWLVGPALSVPIPLFDQGSASTAAARARFRQARHEYFATLNYARADVRAAHAQLEAAAQRIQYFRDVLLPLRQKAVEQALLEYNGMLLGVFDLLETREREFESQMEAMEAIGTYWTARSELERASGGTLPAPTPQLPPEHSATRPAEPAPPAATQPADDPHQHHHH